MTDSRTKNSIRNIFAGLLNKALCLIFPFAIRTIIIYYLGIQYIGVNSLFSSVLQVLNLTELGFSTAVTFALYKPIAENDNSKIQAFLAYFKKIYNLIGTTVLVLGLLVMPFLKYLIKQDCPSDLNLYLLYLLFLLNTTASYLVYGYKSVVFNAHQRSDLASNISSIVVTLRYLLEILVLVAFKNYYLYIIVLLTSTIAQNILINILTKKYYPNCYANGKLSIEEKKQVTQNIKDLFGHKIGGVFINSFDNIIISVFLGATVLGVYNNYYYIMSSVSGILVLLTSSLTASVGNKIVTDSKEENYKLFKKINFVYNWLVGLCTVCLLCLYQPFMELWGKLANETKILLDYDIVILLCIYFYLFTIRNTSCIFKEASGLWHSDRFRPYVETIVNVVTNIILVYFIGLPGIIISTILTLLIGNPWLTTSLFKDYFKISSKEYFFSSVKNILITIISCLLTFTLCNYIDNSILGFILKCGLCITVPNILLIIYYFKNLEFKNLLHNVKQVLKKR